MQLFLTLCLSLFNRPTPTCDTVNSIHVSTIIIAKIFLAPLGPASFPRLEDRSSTASPEPDNPSPTLKPTRSHPADGRTTSSVFLLLLRRCDRALPPRRRARQR
jgi:hypothetical protein